MDKSDDERLMDTFKRMKQLEKQYQEETKEDLINLLVLKQMADEVLEVEGKSIKLWCYVADKTGLKYLTNELPERYFTLKDRDGVFITEGEINIRIPKMMEPLFPDIKYGDEPVLVKLSVSF